MKRIGFTLAVVFLLLASFNIVAAQKASEGIFVDATGCNWQVNFPVSNYDYITWSVNGEIVVQFGQTTLQRCFTKAIEYKVVSTVWYDCSVARTAGQAQVGLNCEGLEYTKSFNPIPLQQSLVDQVDRGARQLAPTIALSIAVVGAAALGIFWACQQVGLCQVEGANATSVQSGG